MIARLANYIPIKNIGNRNWVHDYKFTEYGVNDV